LALVEVKTLTATILFFQQLHQLAAVGAVGIQQLLQKLRAMVVQVAAVMVQILVTMAAV